MPLHDPSLIHIPAVAWFNGLNLWDAEQLEECLDIFSRGTIDTPAINGFTSQGLYLRVSCKKALHPAFSKWLSISVVDEDPGHKEANLGMRRGNAQCALNKNPINKILFLPRTKSLIMHFSLSFRQFAFKASYKSSPGDPMGSRGASE